MSRTADWLVNHPACSAESWIRKAGAERGILPGLIGLADPTAEDEAATGMAVALMEIASMGKGRKLGGEPAGREVKGGDRGRHRASPSGG